MGSVGVSGTVWTGWSWEEAPFGLPGAEPGFREEEELRELNTSVSISMLLSETVDIDHN